MSRLWFAIVAVVMLADDGQLVTLPPPPDPCSCSPCQNDGVCVPTGSSNSAFICKCSRYYTGQACDQPALSNLATKGGGATCTASSVVAQNSTCDNAIDGWVVPGIDWASNADRENAWIEIQFSSYHIVTSLHVLQRCELAAQNKEIQISLGSYLDLPYNLVCQGSNSPTDCSGQYWQRVDLISTIANHIRIATTAVCQPEATTVPNGWREVKVFGYEPALINVGALSMGATCNASSAYHHSDFDCTKALNEVDEPGANNEWMTDGEGAGAWIGIYLDAAHTVMGLGFLQRCNQIEQNKYLTVAFSDGSTQQITLICMNTGLHAYDCDGLFWQHFDLTPVVTTYVRVNIDVICTSDNNGFREIRIFGLKDELGP